MEKHICIFGDSITWGAFDVEKGGWANRLKIFLETELEDAAVYNLGVSGDNTDNVLARFESESRAREANVLVFAIGINDSQYIGAKDNPRISLEKFKENLKKIITQSRTFTQEIMFIGITAVDESKTVPVEWDATKNYDNASITAYNQALQALCAEEKLSFLDMAGVVAREDLYDGLHPDSNGHEKMFLKIKDFVMRGAKIGE